MEVNSKGSRGCGAARSFDEHTHTPTTRTLIPDEDDRNTKFGFEGGRGSSAAKAAMATFQQLRESAKPGSSA